MIKESVISDWNKRVYSAVGISKLFFLKKACVRDIPALLDISISCFSRHLELYGGYPPGFDSKEYIQKYLRESVALTVLNNDIIIGGVFIRKQPNHVCYLSRIFLSSDFQSLGKGSSILLNLFEIVPDTIAWELHVVKKATRTRFFYEKLGFNLKAYSTVNNTKLVLYHRDNNKERPNESSPFNSIYRCSKYR